MEDCLKLERDPADSFQAMVPAEEKGLPARSIGPV
jgi:hypothetical protein